MLVAASKSNTRVFGRDEEKRQRAAPAHTYKAEQGRANLSKGSTQRAKKKPTEVGFLVFAALRTGSGIHTAHASYAAHATAEV